MEMAGPEPLLLFPLSVSRPVTSEDHLLTVPVCLLPDGTASASDGRLGGGQNSVRHCREQSVPTQRVPCPATHLTAANELLIQFSR